MKIEWDKLMHIVPIGRPKRVGDAIFYPGVEHKSLMKNGYVRIFPDEEKDGEFYPFVTVVHFDGPELNGFDYAVHDAVSELCVYARETAQKAEFTLTDVIYALCGGPDAEYKPELEEKVKNSFKKLSAARISIQETPVGLQAVK